MVDRPGRQWPKPVALTALAVLGALVALTCLTVGATFAVLQTSWGGERLRRQVVTRANKQIQGRLEIGRLSFGGNRLEVWNVALRDPEGQAVAQIARAEVDFRILRLLHKEIRISAIVIEKPHLGLVSGPEGLNLTRATAPREKTPKEETPPRAPTREEGWVVQLDRFDLKDGALGMVSIQEGGPEQKVDLRDLTSFISARYATGNGGLASTFRLTGRSALAPVGPFRIESQVRKTNDAIHFAMQGDLLGGTAKARMDLARTSNKPDGDLEQLDAEVKVAIPEVPLHGHGWGPVRVDGLAHPGGVPRLEMLLAIPGIELAGKNVSQTAFDFQGRLKLIDLGHTMKAVQALAGGDSSPAAGHGQIDFAVGGPMKGALATWSTHWTGQFERLRFSENLISGLSLEGRVAHLSARPGEADFKIAIDSIEAGKTKIGKLAFAARLQQQDVSVRAHVVSPQPVNLAVAGRIDNDGRGFSLATLSLGYPHGQWTLEKPARVELGDQRVALTRVRLVSEEQALSVEGSKTGDQLSAHLAIEKLRLDLLPELLADPHLHLAGTVDVDVKASGDTNSPKVVAHVALKQVRFQGFSRVYAKVDATLADQVVDGTLSVEAPFTAAEARFKIPADPLAPRAPFELRLDVTRLDLGDALRSAAVAAPADGKVTVRVDASGSPDNPKVDVAINARELSVARPAVAKHASEVIDVGHARVHLAYAHRSARADIDFSSAHGGTLKVDAVAKIDLSYPRVTRGIVAAKIPIEGKVVAHDLEVAWISRFNERVESLGGQVNANAKLAGTVGDPQFLGDVRWKNGNVVATVPKKAAAAAKR
jgi:hypothetical protein